MLPCQTHLGPKACSCFGDMAYCAAATAVFDEWKSNEVLCHRAAKMCLAMIGTKELVDRREVNENYALLAPVVEHVGFLAYFNSTRCSNQFVSYSYRFNWIHLVGSAQDSDQLCQPSWRRQRCFFTTAAPVEKRCLHVRAPFHVYWQVLTWLQ